MRIVTILISILLSQPLIARDVYKWTTDDGEVIYSQNYRPGAVPIRVQDDKNRSSIDLEDLNKDSEAAAPREYSNFEIVQPGDDETIRSDEGTVSVGLSISPPLGKGHVINLYVDGNKLGSEIKTTQMVLQQLGRGTHTLKAEIIDAEGNKMKETGSRSFHLRQPVAN